MSLARTRRYSREINYWPGFVDALSTLLLTITFLLSIFAVAQVVLSQEVNGRDTVLTRLNRQIAELTELLSLEKTKGAKSDAEIGALKATLDQAKSDQSRLQQQMDLGGGAANAAERRAGQLQSALEAQTADTNRALSQIDSLNQQIAALRRQLAAIESALQASESREQDAQTRIADLGSRLNVALAQKVQELARYRSDFFGRLRDILGNRPDIRIVGDRFVFQSEVFFDPGQADLKPEGMPELDKVATAMREIISSIPPDIPWVLRVDGHTDKRPLSGTGKFATNWDLSAARAIAVVRYLQSQGLPPEHLLAAGFGEFQPLDLGDTEDAFKRNRRIELKLTDR
ncbi:MAG: peptidoglycan -binding protein [Hyphomicrobiales bacterium]|nr:peptidoglycan -binding protein [Hyphomicrobiales bacterium]MBV8770289.1 peptidoglycan -binding protein [Hyphomicrobiales bacterium]MBV9138859.1 peptidoglycan -binding protein [Hyphomicrobiales bacterium]MBV9974100.1 peptidoglycan -binding protein [Hyphomicrobiales bacterium]